MLSGSSRCSKLVLYFLCTSPGVSCCFQENCIWKSGCLGTRCAFGVLLLPALLGERARTYAPLKSHITFVFYFSYWSMCFKNFQFILISLIQLCRSCGGFWLTLAVRDQASSCTPYLPWTHMRHAAPPPSPCGLSPPLAPCFLGITVPMLVVPHTSLSPRGQSPLLLDTLRWAALTLPLALQAWLLCA